MNNDTTTITELATSFDFSQWEVAKSEPAADVNYKTANPELHGEYQEYKTKWHTKSLEQQAKRTQAQRDRWDRGMAAIASKYDLPREQW